MPIKNLINKIYTHYFLPFMVLGIVFYLFGSKPTPVGAQVCTTINPEVVYYPSNIFSVPISNSPSSPNPGSARRRVTIAFTRGNPRMSGGMPENFVVALASWELRYTSNDEHWKRGWVMIDQGSFSVSGRQVSFDLDIGLMDDNPINSNSPAGGARFVAFAWE